MLFSPSFKALLGMLCLYESSHFGTDENSFLLLIKMSRVPSSLTFPQYGMNFNVAMSMLANSESLNVNMFVLSCLLISVMFPIILTFSRLYSFVVQNFVPTEDTLSSREFVFCSSLLSRLTGSTTSLASSFSKIVTPLSFIVKTPFLFFAVNETTELSVLSGSSREKSILFVFLSNHPFLTMNGLIFSSSFAFVVSTRKMFGMLFSLSRPLDVLKVPGDALSSTLDFSSPVA